MSNKHMAVSFEEKKNRTLQKRLCRKKRIYLYIHLSIVVEDRRLSRPG